jgi:hypothetical protein
VKNKESLPDASNEVRLELNIEINTYMVMSLCQNEEEYLNLTTVTKSVGNVAQSKYMMNSCYQSVSYRFYLVSVLKT